ncbi:uncharacterized protein LOC110225752 [Arabidopsis lyrata subsp. lyrata]|uniref:uncharacterized protein LOC110225752 n=1 Tax=Arabidopsis lyrata subsp. lyrata TaxID=81972 RepID=UPI000A29E76E|nr:uncharacterized protein LOC110225752 [Arabidopsis lyrata subsp. lyrata]|eukprot:XP_020871380.1 uncharacterized protein LOC110225752 [Arabidopsis lyrata subsp. lyrata]
MAPNFLRYVLSTLTVSVEAGFSLTTSELLGLFRARESAAAGIFSMKPILDRNLIDGMPSNDGPWRKYWFFFRVNPHSVQGLSGLLLANWSAKLGNQTIPRPTVDFLSFFRIVSEGETNWNSFTLHKAGLAIKDGQTHPLDPPPEEKEISSLNARDKRKMQAEIKALKDQLSEIGRKKRIAAISRVGNFHRKTLLVDDDSLEAALSIAVDIHGAEILNDPPVATTICPSEQEQEGGVTSSPGTKRKAPDSDTLSNERLKTVRLSSLPRVPSPPHSVFPSSESLDSELPLPGDRVILEKTDEPRPEAPLSQGLSVRTQNPLPASISGGEEIGDIFRSFQTREGASLPPFSVWRPEIPFMETNGMIFHYENLLHQAKRETAKAKKEVDELRLVNQSERLERAKALESSFENMKKTLAANEQRIRMANAERDSARSNALLLEAELEETTALFEEANQEIELLTRNRARDIAEAEHNAREEMRGFGRCRSLLNLINNNSTKMFEEYIDLVKTEANGEPEELRPLGWGTSIQVPNVLIERLSAQDHVKATKFINKLIVRHDELENEKKEIRQRIMELEKRRIDIARELHRLEAHPSDWDELGLQEYGNMPGCIMSIVDLAGQGAKLFRNSRPF